MGLASGDLGNSSSILNSVTNNLGSIITILFIVFIVIAILSSLTKRLGKNIYNLIVVIATAILIPIVLNLIIERVLQIEFIKNLIASLMEEISFIKGASISFVESVAIVFLTAFITPILFIVIRLVLKIALGIVLLFIPPIRHLLTNKVKGVKVRKSLTSRLISVGVAVITGMLMFFIAFGPILAVADLALDISNEIPNEVRTELININNKNIETSSNEGENKEGEDGGFDLTGIIEGLDDVTEKLKPMSDSLAFSLYKGLGFNKITINSLDNISKTTYSIDGEEYATKGYSDFLKLGKGLAIIGSYVILESNVSGMANNNMELSKFQEGVNGILSNNAVIEMAEPLMCELVKGLCKDSFGLSDELTNEVIETINLKKYFKYTEEEKFNESVKISNLILDVISGLEVIKDHGSEVLNYTNAFGKILDSMHNTNSFSKTPGKLIIAFTNSNEKIQQYLNVDNDGDGVTTLDTLISSVEGGETSYSAYLTNIKASLNIAMTFAGKDLGTGNSTNDKTDDEIQNAIKDDLNSIYNNSDEAVKDVMIEIVKDAVNEIPMDSGTENLKNSLVVDYFENLYNYAETLKTQAGDDIEKQQEAVKMFEAESQTITSVIALVENLESGESIEKQTVEKLAEVITTSAVLKQTAENLNLLENANAKQELQNKFDEVPEQTKQEIQEMLNQKIESTESTSDKESIELLKSILGIA